MDVQLVDFQLTRDELKLLALEYLKRFYSTMKCAVEQSLGTSELQELWLCSQRLEVIAEALLPEVLDDELREDINALEDGLFFS